MSQTRPKPVGLIARLLLRPVNWVVERYFPTGVFFGNSVTKGFEEFSTTDGKAKAEAAAASFLVARAIEEDIPGFNIMLKDFSLKGVPAGSWRLTIARVEPPKQSGQSITGPQAE